ncbi:G0/G1 switch protein 2 [Gadus morhua]|uniref:G0/G1 switch protein 2 n=1 Tax=Gadus morhua TaxID=8049 RepID=UPI0011B66E86|nr:G0/G1 switch protein 2 [Gadus morhua]
METVQELVPFVREMLSQKPNRGMLKVYLLGTVVAVVGTVVGTVVGLVDTVCHPFSGEGPDDAEMAMLMLGESRRRTIAGLPVKRRGREQQEEVQGGTCLETDKTAAALSKTHGPQALRTAANRLHAS